MIVETNGVTGALAAHRRAWGDRHFARGVDQLVEETGELLQALMKERRGFDARDAIVEEIADVCLCLELIGEALGVERQELLAIVTRKAVVLDARLEHGTADPRVRAGHVEEKERAKFERAAGELQALLKRGGMPCGHTIGDLIGGKDADGRRAVTKCGACLAERQTTEQCDCTYDETPPYASCASCKGTGRKPRVG